MHSPLAWVGGGGGLLLPWMEGGGRLLLPFVGDIGGLWVGTVGGRVHRWWVPWMLFAGASGGAGSPLVGVGDGCSPPLMSPCWVLVSAVCGGWWWVLVLALTLIHVASLRAPIGGGCSDPFVSPCWVLVSAIGGGWWWVLTPVCAPHCVITPIRVARCVARLSVGGVLLDVYGTRGLTID